MIPAPAAFGVGVQRRSAGVGDDPAGTRPLELPAGLTRPHPRLRVSPRVEPVGPVGPVGPKLRVAPARPIADVVLAGLDLGRLPAASLAQVNAAASLQTRVDRKYVVDVAVARELVGRLAATHHVLGIAGRRATTYISQYFDTPDSQAFRAHAQGRRRRWKVRTRLYYEDGLCRLELKTKRRGQTVKDAVDAPVGALCALTVDGLASLASAGSSRGVDLPLDRLGPNVRIDYTRATLVDLVEGTRLTVDGGLVGQLGTRRMMLRADRVLIETKGTLRPAGADLLLFRSGIRPVSVSKHAVAVSMLDQSLPGHRWRRLARLHFELAHR